MEHSIHSQLPTELISTIFLHCLPDRPSFASRYAPSALLQVCSSWRTIAICTPQLWSYIRVAECDDVPENVLPLIRLWISRSAQVDLCFDISLFKQDIEASTGVDDPARLNLIREILTLIRPHLARIKCFRGIFPEHLMPQIGIDKMLNAENVSLHGTLVDNSNIAGLQADDSTRKTEPKIVFPSKRLKSLTICGITIDIDVIGKYSQLSHLELRNLRSDMALCQRRIYDLLCSLPHMESAVVDATGLEKRPIIGTTKRHNLPKLRVLSLTWTFPADIAMLLDAICVPGLKKLNLRGTPLTNAYIWPHLLHFLDASQAPLIHLSLGDFGSVNFLLSDCVGRCPQLRQLTLNHCVVTDDLLLQLTCTDDVWDVAMLPCLEVFTMGVCEGFAPKTLVDFLRSRTTRLPPGVAELQDAAILFCPPMTANYREPLALCNIADLTFEAMESSTALPYARVVQVHEELIAFVNQ